MKLPSIAGTILDTIIKSSTFRVAPLKLPAAAANGEKIFLKLPPLPKEGISTIQPQKSSSQRPRYCQKDINYSICGGIIDNFLIDHRFLLSMYI
jgi:hypothetical protein